MFVSMHAEHSLRLDKVDATSFKSVHYDHSNRTWVERIFRWDGEAFVQAAYREFEMSSRRAGTG